MKLVFKIHPTSYAPYWGSMVEVIRETKANWFVRWADDREVRFSKNTRKPVGEKYMNVTVHFIEEYAEDTLATLG